MYFSSYPSLLEPSINAKLLLCSPVDAEQKDLPRQLIPEVKLAGKVELDWCQKFEVPFLTVCNIVNRNVSVQIVRVNEVTRKIPYSK